ncbi:hypothetical protein DFJ74DRAFT_663271 [Hyaloraphidium curvatum]|nr:hypothetical protein DFJ74DRAFT_663271 [Hyaloraphidium curvatum]
MWSRLVGSRARDVPAGIAVDTYSDTVYVGGTTYGAVAGDYSRGGGDIFISQLNAADGRILWNRQYGGPGTETMSDIVVYHQRIFIAGVYPSGRGLWTSYWAEGDSPDVPKNVPNGGLRKYYSMEIYGGNDVFVCELTNVGEAQTGVPTDWTRVPDGMIKWCSTYGSPGDDVASSLRIFDYHMSFPWLASGVAYTNDAYTIAPRGGRDTIYTLYWEYDIPGFGRTERTDPFAPTGPVVCPAR